MKNKEISEYIKKNLARGQSLNQIKTSLSEHGFTKDTYEAAIKSFTKPLISNNLLAIIVISFMLITVFGNYYIVTHPGQIQLTGMFTNIVTGTASVCVNSRPTINISTCPLEINVTDNYYCNVTASDSNFGTYYSYYDNFTLADINITTGVINFTPGFWEDGYFSIKLNVTDGSNCTNDWDSAILNLQINPGCIPPVFVNFSNNFSIPRNESWSLQVNATDGNNDTITYGVSLLNSSAYAAFGSAVSINPSTGLLNISPSILHIGYHILNITASDGTTCQNSTIYTLINVTVEPTNTPPAYIGLVSDLDYTWDEDTTIANVYNLDDYFNDSDDDCLKYEVEFLSAAPFVTITIENNVDPRTGCPASHFVTLTPDPNEFGQELVYFMANDTINISKQVLVTYRVNNVPEPRPTPSVAGEGGSGGGGAGSATLKRCEEKWYCGGFSQCDDGIMARNCTDVNKCQTSRFKPNETMICIYLDHCYDEVQNYEEEGIDCGGPCPEECATCFDAIKNCHTLINGSSSCEEGIDCGGPCRPCLSETDFITPTDQALSPEDLTYIWIYSSLVLLLIGIIALLIIFFKRFKKRKKKRKPREKLYRKDLQEIKKWDLRRLFMKIRDKFIKTKKPDVPLPPLPPDIPSVLAKLESKIGKIPNDAIIKDLGIIMRKWLKQRYKLEYEATYEELSTELKGKKKEDLLKPFFNKLIELEFAGTQITQVQVAETLKQAKTIIGRKVKRKTKVTAAALLILILVGSMLFTFQPQITGMLVQEKFQIDINKDFTEDSYYDLNILDADSLKISGKIAIDGKSKVYLGEYLVFDSDKFFRQRLASMIKTDNYIEFTDKNQIDLVIDYNPGTPWDRDDNGIAHIQEAVDLTVKNTRLNGNLDESKLCTIWQVDSFQQRQASCYGSSDCCAILELLPERDNWQDTFYLNFGKQGALQDNIVTAKIIYADYSLDDENAYSDIIESDVEQISVLFEDDLISFEDICEESCSIDELSDNRLRIEIERGVLRIDKVALSAFKEDTLEFSEIPNITIAKNDKITLDLTQYISLKGIELGNYKTSNLDVIIKDGIATLTPKKGFEGKLFTFFTANDSDKVIVSNLIEVDIIQKFGKAVHEQVKLGEPVKWKKLIKGQKKILLDHVPKNMTIRTTDRLKIKNFRTQAEELIIEEDIDEVEIEYFTDGPQAIEEISTKLDKKVVISSDVHYTDITAFTVIEESPLNHINLYHLQGAQRIKVDFIGKDTNNNGLIDYIEWTVPSLSNQTYEVNISVLNIQSYPTVGGLWEVRFTTVGKSDLIISAINLTTYGTDIPDDLEPQELRCGSDILTYNWQGNDVSYTDYECNETGYWTVKVLTEGTHNQKFTFGNATAYANNYASINISGDNLSIWDDTDSGTWYATDNITFYANYTNGTGTSNGTCTIKFNLTGTWNDSVNMSYNGVSLPYNFSRTIPYKGTTYFNVICSNSTMQTLNVTDTILIENTQPIMLNLGTVYVTEDTSYLVNISKNVSDPDLNDNFTYEYGSPPNLPESLFTFDSGAGLISILASASSEAGAYDITLIVKDSDNEPGSDKLDVVISAVNDAPVFITPSGSSIDNATTETLYTYQLVASDEEEGSVSDYNFSIISCEQAYIADCSALTLVLNTTTGWFNFTPVNDDTGNYTLNITATDSLSSLTYKLINFSVLDVNNAPHLLFICNNSNSAAEDSLFNCTINATDPESDVLTFTTNASWFTLYSVKDDEALANFTPTNSEVGNHSILVNVSDGYLSHTTIINFTVNNTNDTPYYYDIGQQIAIVGQEFSYIALANDTDFYRPHKIYSTLNENLTYAINLSIIDISNYSATSALINFTPIEAQKGNYSIRINVTDSSLLLNFTIFNLSIRNNSAPTFDFVCNNTRSFIEDITYYCTVNATDLEGDNFTFTANVTSWFSINVSTGNVTLLGTDSLVGNHTVRINVTDYWQDTNFVDVIFEINNTPEPPEFIGVQNISTDQGDLFVYNLSANVTDPDQNTPQGDSLRYYVNYSLPSGNLTINLTTGIINFTPLSMDVGSYKLNFTVNDSYGLMDHIIITFNVTDVNDYPALDYVCDNERTAVEDTWFNCTINASDVDLDALSFYTNVSWFNLTNISTTSVIANFTPSNTQVGNHSINITVSDGRLNSSTIIRFIVNNTNDPPTIIISNLNATEDTLFNYTVNASDDDLLTPDSDTLTYFTNSTLFTINSSTGQFNFTPNASQVGNYSILFNVSDSFNYSWAIINFTILEFSDAPVLQSIPSLQGEDAIPFYFDINATDEEDPESALRFRTNATASFFIINSSTGVISFTPNSSHTGLHKINVTVNDTDGNEDSQVFNFTIISINLAPNITQILPSNSSLTIFVNRSQYPLNITNVTLVENTTIIFNHTSIDANSDPINTTWYNDGSLVSQGNSTQYSYSIDFLEAGQHNITLIVHDGRGGNDTFDWNITVVNTNRPPIFGLIEHNQESEFTGTDNGTNVTSGGIITGRNSSDSYPFYAEYISQAIDMGPLVSAFYNPIGFTNISWSAITPSGTNVTMQTRTSSNSLVWSNWSIIELGRSYTTSGERIISPNTTYIQYKLILQTNDSNTTANTTAVYIRHKIPDLTIDQGEVNSGWLDLDYYFQDLDTDDTLTFNFTQNTNVVLTYSQATHVLGITAPSDWWGSETIVFTANDSTSITNSNNVTITVDQVDVDSDIEYIYLTKTNQVVKTRIRLQDQARYLEILSPEHVTAFSADTVVAPIILKNNAEAILNGIDLTATVNNENVDVWFSRDSVNTLNPGSSTKSNLFMKWNGFIEEFDVIVNATSREPEYHDSAIISVTGMARVENNRSITEENLRFVRDLLKTNPECLELWEILDEAERQIQASEFDEAKEKINFVIEACKFLIQADREIEKPVQIEQRREDLFKLISGILLLLLFIATLIIVVLLYRRRSLY